VGCDLEVVPEAGRFELQAHGSRPAVECPVHCPFCLPRALVSASLYGASCLDLFA
jgi:hypothetical protein